MTGAIQRGARFPSLSLFFGLVAALCAIEFWIVACPSFRDHPALLSTAVTVDLLLGIPLLGYLLLVRRARFSPRLLLPLVLVSFVITNLIVPREYRELLRRFELVLPLIELALIVLLVARIRSTVRAYREERPRRPFASEALEIALERTLGSSLAASATSVEFLMLQYAFTGWFRHYSGREFRPFTYHRAGGYLGFLAMMSALLVVETIGVHIMLLQWSETAAWIVTAVTIYGFLWFLGDYHAMRLHPVLVDNEVLHVRCGLRWRAEVRRDQIVAMSTSEPKDGSERVNLSVIGGAGLWIELAQPVTVCGLFGRRKQARFLGLSIEDDQGFRECMRDADVDGS